MNIVFAVLAVVIMLILVVGFHEFGHYLAARVFGIRIREVSIGFGKALIHFRSPKDVYWVWRLFPLGGFVQLLDSRNENLSSDEFPYCLDKRPVWQRILVYASGVIANMVMALFAFTLVFTLGTKTYTPTVSSVTKAGIAANAGLQAGDRILKVNKTMCKSWQNVAMAILANAGSQQKLSLEVEGQGGVKQTKKLDLSQWRYAMGSPPFFDSIGLVPVIPEKDKLVTKRYAFIPALQQATWSISYYLSFFSSIIKQIVVGNIPIAALLGPLGLFSVTANFFAAGLVPFLYFIAIFSVAVGFLNSIPFPGLDGASILYAVIEKMRKKPMTPALELLLQRLGLIFFMVFLVQLLMNDLRRFLQ